MYGSSVKCKEKPRTKAKLSNYLLHERAITLSLQTIMSARYPVPTVVECAGAVFALRWSGLYEDEGMHIATPFR
jgi:hypothetical protein